MKENKVLQKIIKKKHKKQKSISPIISVVLMIVIATIIITLVLSWGKGFSNKSLADTGSILKEDSSLTGFIYSSNESPSSYNVKNLSDKEITITSYKIIGTGDSEILGKELVLSEPVNLNSGSSVVLPIMCAPDNSFVINLITDEGKYIEVPINKVNSNLNSCNSSSVPDLVCLGLEENGSGNTIDDPFVICSVDDLNNIRAALTKHYKLGINLDLNVSPYNDGNGWEPIGICGPLEYECYIGNYSYTFTGSFNGNNHVISHLYINRPATSYIGLFGYTNEAIIYNLILEDNNIFGSFHCGSLLFKSGGSFIIFILQAIYHQNYMGEGL